MRTASRFFLLSTALVTSVPATAGTQQPAKLEPGSRVRIQAAGTVVGALVSVDTTNLILRPRGWNDTMTIPVATIRRLQVSTGLRSAAGKGAGLGGIVGAGVGLLAGVAAAIDDPCEPQTFCLDLFGPEDIPLFVVVSGATGVALGALIGSFNRTDRWTDVPVEGLQLGIVPLPGGRIGFALSRTL